MKLLKTIILLSFFSWSAISAAEGLKLTDSNHELWITGTLISYHTDRSSHYNEFNPGIGLEYKLSNKFKFVLGEYKNSIRRQSEYIGITYVPFEIKGVKIGFTMGLVSGYSDSIAPMILPVVGIEGQKVGINLIILPPKILSTGVIGLQLKYKWK